MYPKPARCYIDTAAFNVVDLSYINIGKGESVMGVQEAKYLGSYTTQAGTDLRDVEERISKASQACGVLKRCLFRRAEVAAEVKRSFHCGFGPCDAALRCRAPVPHCEDGANAPHIPPSLHAVHSIAACGPYMCRLGLWHTRHNHVKTTTLLTRLGIQTTETYIARRHMRWLGHVWRMPEMRLPKQLLTAWLLQKGPVGRPERAHLRANGGADGTRSRSGGRAGTTSSISRN
jgi:hypothetical protein